MATRQLNRRGFLGMAGLGAAALAYSGNSRAAGKPNILVILADDLGYGDLAAYGAKDMRTPNIDRLLSLGMRFDEFYANCPVCSPTRAALLSGRYPDISGVPGVIRTHRDNSWGYLSKDAVLLPKVLKRAGYHTGIVGKWHLGLESPNTPNDRGFDHFHGFLGDMMDNYWHHRRHDINYMRLDRQEVDPEGHATDIFTRWAQDYIEERAAAPEPFFLYLAYNAPHGPIQPPADFLERVIAREPGISELRANIVALIEHLDDGVGRVLKTLEESGAAENTLIIFTSDNGGQLNLGANNGNITGTKGQMFEGGIRVPACAVWPGRIAPGTRAKRLAISMDIYPTVCAAAGAEFENPIDGISFLSELLGETPPEYEERTLFWVRREGGGLYGGRAFYAARRGDWKLLQNTPFEPMALYNLEEDPMEAQPSGNRGAFGELSKALQDHVNEAGAVPWQPPLSGVNQ